jgi:alpha-D-xyloside xylohydrolase
VLGLKGSGARTTIEVDGTLSNVTIDITEQNYLYGQGDGEKNLVMAGMKGLNIPVGKNFSMTWKI